MMLLHKCYLNKNYQYYTTLYSQLASLELNVHVSHRDIYEIIYLLKYVAQLSLLQARRLLTRRLVVVYCKVLTNVIVRLSFYFRNCNALQIPIQCLNLLIVIVDVTFICICVS